MIFVVEPGNRHLYGELLTDMHRLRYDCFIRERKWSLPCAENDERDEFDHKFATYLLHLDRLDGEIRVSGMFRIVPTTAPTMFDSVFRDLFDVEPPSGPHVAEGSRQCVASWARKRRPGWYVNGEVLTSVGEYCLGRGIRHGLMVSDVGHTARLIAHGYDIRQMGGSRVTDGQEVAAYLHTFSEEHTVLARDKAGLKGPLCVQPAIKADLDALLATLPERRPMVDAEPALRSAAE
ncbi:acyl-homoserine-lactone synthase [Zavarzinia sp. CC-PAN008]|uniref:acyl-homoserine-lactone synthase n=1 Tax=Zavarzinia sp. CC-PAN008 TaxID=3243332 RepID=UPI003F748FD6